MSIKFQPPAIALPQLNLRVTRFSATATAEPTVEIMQNGTGEAHNAESLDTAPRLLGTTKHEPDPSIKNILVTGGAGFIASWVVRHLTLTYPDDYNIFSFDKVDYCATLKNTKCLDSSPNFQFVFGDVTDKEAVLRCLRQYNIDTILHFAAQSHVDLSFGNSFAFTETNVRGTHIMLEAAVKVGVKRFIHVSTDEVNGETKHGDPDLLEDSILSPTNPYAASKAAAEMYVNAYAKSFKLPCIIVRSNNVYGPHQYPEKIIPKFCSLLTQFLPLILHGSGLNTRRYLFASDAADAFDNILHKGKLGEIYNVDSTDEISNIDLARKLLARFDIRAEEEEKWIKHVTDRPFNDMRYAVDARKLRGLGWTQKVGLEEGLEQTVDWYRKWGKRWWGDVSGCLSAFPEVSMDLRVDDYVRELGVLRHTPLLQEGAIKARKVSEGLLKKQAGIETAGGLLVPPMPGIMTTSPSNEADVGGKLVAAASAANAGKNPRKRAREIEGKENEDVGEGGGKRVLLGNGLGDDEVVR